MKIRPCLHNEAYILCGDDARYWCCYDGDQLRVFYSFLPDSGWCKVCVEGADDYYFETEKNFIPHSEEEDEALEWCRTTFAAIVAEEIVDANLLMTKYHLTEYGR